MFSNKKKKKNFNKKIKERRETNNNNKKLSLSLTHTYSHSHANYFSSRIFFVWRRVTTTMITMSLRICSDLLTTYLPICVYGCLRSVSVQLQLFLFWELNTIQRATISIPVRYKSIINFFTFYCISYCTYN